MRNSPAPIDLSTIFCTPKAKNDPISLNQLPNISPRIPKEPTIQKWVEKKKTEELRQKEELKASFLQEFLLNVPIVDHYRNNQMSRARINVRERALKIAKQIFQIYYVELRLVTGFSNSAYESAIKIIPLEQEETLYHFVAMFVPELCRIPISFMEKLKVHCFNLCLMYQHRYTKSLSILKKKKLDSVIERTFAINQIKNRDDLKNLFYKPLMHYFLFEDKEFAKQWHKMTQDTTEDVHTFWKVNLNGLDLQELIHTFKIIIDPSTVTEKDNTNDQKSKNELLKQALINYDPDGMGKVLRRPSKMLMTSKTKVL